MRTLLVIDMFTGEEERLREDDGNFRASIASCAERNGISFEEALAALDEGATLTTAGFLRRLV